MNLDRETIASAIVGTGGAWMLGSALFNGRNGRWNAAQTHGLAYSGLGFLLTAAAARWLQHTGPRGMALSLMGTMIAMRGMYILLRERAARTGREKPRAPK